MIDDKQSFKKYREIQFKEELKIIDFVFYEGLKAKEDNRDVALSLFQLLLEMINLSEKEQISEIHNYEYLLFYLSLSLNLNNNFDEAYFYAAQLYQNLKKFEKAEKFYNKIDKNHELYLESQKNIAINKIHFKNFNEAEKHLIILLENYNQDKNLLIALADLYRSSKYYEKAIINYSKIINDINIDINEKWYLFYKRGVCYERLGNWGLAEKDLLESLEINSESSQVLNYLAYSWVEKNINIDRSIEMLNIAYNKDPNSHYILDSLAWAHFKNNELSTAVLLMEKVIMKAPAEAISLDHLGDIYFAMKRKREAFYMWKQAKDLAEPDDDIIQNIQKKIEKFNAG